MTINTQWVKGLAGLFLVGAILDMLPIPGLSVPGSTMDLVALSIACSLLGK